MKFSQLPSEIVCDILGAADSINTVLAASQTCKRFREIWQSNLEGFLTTLLPASFSSYELATKAARAILIAGGSTDATPTSKDIFAQEREAGIALQLFTEQFMTFYGTTRFFYPRKIEPPLLSSTERLRFISAYHALKILLLLADNHNDHPMFAQTLQQLSVHDYYNIRDVSSWVCEMPYKAARGHGDEMGNQRTEELYSRLPKEVPKWWSLADQRLGALYAQHPAIAERRNDFVCVAPDWNPGGIFTLFDHCQDQVEDRSKV